MIITNDNHMIIKNRYGKKPMAFEISWNFYGKKCSFIYSKKIYSGNVPAVITSFFPFCRMKEDFMELYLVREQFQSDIIGKVNC